MYGQRGRWQAKRQRKTTIAALTSKAEMMAAQLGVPLLGRLPIDPQIAQLCDEGRIEEYQSDAFTAIARQLAEAAPQAKPLSRNMR